MQINHQNISRDLPIEKRIVAKLQEIENLKTEISVEANKTVANSLNFLLNFFGLILVTGTLIQIGAIR